jgi:hypothetical protein
LCHRTSADIPCADEQDAYHARNFRVRSRAFQALLRTVSEADFEGADRGLGPIGHLQLPEDVRDVVLDHLQAEEELGGDLRVAAATGDEPEYLLFALG